MDLSIFFHNLNGVYDELASCSHEQSLKSVTWFYREEFPQVQQADIVIIGCPHHAGCEEAGSELAPNAIRQFLYRLAAPTDKVKIADLGNLKFSESNIYETIAKVLEFLLKQNKTVLLLGGTHDTAYGQYLAYQNLERLIEYVSVDSRLDLVDCELGLTNRTFHNQIFRHKPNVLKHYANLGTQIYYVSEAERKVLKALQFESQRLSEFRQNVRRAEPYFRTADMVSLDLSAVRCSDSPGTNEPCPAGFTVEEICQIARFIGMGYHVSSLSINEVNPLKDPAHQTAHLAALILWHFIEGYYNRIYDEPSPNRSNLRCFIAELEGSIVPDITFYKSETTDRWWMEVPYPTPSKNLNKKLTKLIPCCEEDYLQAVGGEIPERWWIMHLKFLEELV